MNNYKGKNNRSNKRNNIKRNSKGNNSTNAKDPEMKVRGTDPIKDRTNDPKWYAANPQLMTAAGSYSFSNVLGTKLPITQHSFPGIMTMSWIPTLGTDDPAVIATRNVYSFVRHANSGSANYDAPDLMMYILAVDSAFSYIANLIRLYGVMRLFDQRNKYMPRAIVRSMGINYDSILENLANLNYYINSLVARASVLWIPDTMPFVERHYWLNSNIFCDGASSKAQLYIPLQYSYYKYNPTLTSYGGGLEPKQLPDFANGLTYTQLVNFGEDLFSQLDANNEDFGIMGGDILKAYGKEHLYTISEIPFNYTVMPIYSTEVLSQFHNATTTGILPGNIVQSPNGDIKLEWPTSGTDAGARAYIPSNLMLDFFQSEAPTPEQVMVATRLSTAWQWWNTVESGGTSKYSIVPGHVGTEIVATFIMWYYDGEALRYSSFYTTTPKTKVTPTMVAMLSKFDWAPFVYVSDTDSCAISDTNIIEIIGDVENYTTINSESLRKLHTTATWSEFGIPAM